MDIRNKFNPELDDNIEIRSIYRANKLYTSKDISERFEKFFRFGYIDRENITTGSKEYLFFTKPHLYLFSSNATFENPYPGKVSINDLHPSIIKHSSTLCSLYHESPYLFYQLSRVSSKFGYNTHNFIPILTNTVASSLDLPTIDAEYSELNKTTMGATRFIRSHSIMSNNTFDFTIEFNDNKFLEVYKLAKIYDEYMNLKSSGLLDIVVDIGNPGGSNNQSGTYGDMLTNLIANIDTDSFSIYRIIVSDNGEDILHWSKLWGVTFSNVPRDSISNIGDDGKISIPLGFKADHVSDLDPLIIADFNSVSGIYANDTNFPKTSKIWDSRINDINATPVGTPYITGYDENGNLFGGLGRTKPTYYKLKFSDVRDRSDL